MRMALHRKRTMRMLLMMAASLKGTVVPGL
jgi:hypothetical protein